MSEFVKLYPGFFEGSLRDSPPYARLLFLAMLSKADRNGIVKGHPSFWAAYVCITMDEVREGIAILEAPDPESQSPDEEGRRIASHGSGPYCWRIVNYRAYYEKGRDADRREAKRNWDRENRPSGHARQSDTVRHSPTQSVQSDPKKKRKRKVNTPPTPPGEGSPPGSNPSEKTVEVVARSVIAYFNKVTGRKLTEQAQAQFAIPRLREQYTPGDLCMVIDFKQARWGSDEKMREFLRPETLFRKSHFDQYLADAKAHASGEWNKGACKRAEIIEQLSKEGYDK